MVETRLCTNVWSSTNAWIDFCILINRNTEVPEEVVDKIIRKSYDDWFTLPDTESEPVTDYIKRQLHENGIGCEIYYKESAEV